MYVVIMAGGGGTRLRPVSTANRPKPFLPLLPTGETLLERTVRRLRGDDWRSRGAARPS
jgi:mannose-1-phosphate guanylyltransferase